MTNMTAVPFLPQPLRMTNHRVSALAMYSVFIYKLSTLFCLLSYSMVCPCMTTVLLVMYVSSISSSLFVLWWCLDRCGPGLYRIWRLYWCITQVFFDVCIIGWQHLSLKNCLQWFVFHSQTDLIAKQ